MDNVVSSWLRQHNVIQNILIGSLPTSSGVQCSKPPPQTGWRTSFIFPDWQRKKRRGWSKDIKGTITITFHLLLDIRLAVHYLSVQFSQPNMQARQIAPFISKSQLRSIAEDPSSFRMITTRHPFFRLEIIIQLTSQLMMSSTFRLLSAFRDKFERCTTSWDCTKRKDWQVFTFDVNWWDNTKCNSACRYFHRQGSAIVKKYRKLALNKFGQNFFSEQ